MIAGLWSEWTGHLHLVHNQYTDKYRGQASRKGAGAGLGVEVGRPWAIGDGWSVEPQAQVRYQATRYAGFQMPATRFLAVYGDLQYEHAFSGGGRRAVAAQLGLRANW